MIWDKEAVRQLRQKLELTQTEFAEFLGCRQQTISEWEQGLYAPANAYGKLLTMIKNQNPGPFVNVPSPEKVESAQSDDSEMPESRPFDPAVD